MGRVTYQGMAQYFPTAADHPYAEVMNKTPKAVFSGTLKTTEWANSSILSGDTSEQIEKLRQEGAGEILAHGGVSFAQSLVRLDLVDEYHLAVFPHLVGSGRSLFADGPSRVSLSLCPAQPSATEWSDLSIADAGDGNRTAHTGLAC